MKQPKLVLISDVEKIIKSVTNPRDGLLVSLLYFHAMRLRDIPLLRFKSIITQPFLKTLELPAAFSPRCKNPQIRLYRHQGKLFSDHRNSAPRSNRYIFPIHVRRVQQILADFGMRNGLGLITASDLRYSRAFYLAINGHTLANIQLLLRLKTRFSTKAYIKSAAA